MSTKTEVQIALVTARTELAVARSRVAELKGQRKAEVEAQKTAKAEAQKNSAAVKAERLAVKEKAKAEKIERLQAALAKLQVKEDKKNSNAAVRKASRKAGPVTVTKG